MTKYLLWGSSHQADILKSNLVHFNTRKHRNETIYYSVGYLEDAIQQKNKVLFRYFDLDEHGEKESIVGMDIGMS